MKMDETMKILLLLLEKNFLVRRSREPLYMVCQLMLSICFVWLMLGYISVNMAYKMMVQHPDPNITTEDIIISNFSKISHQIRFTPNDTFTNNIMASVQNCLGLHSENVLGSTDEDAMLEEIGFDQIKNNQIVPIGIVFYTTISENIPSNFKYKIRSLSYSIESVQICLDKAFINMVTINNDISRNATWSIQQIPKIPDRKVLFCEIHEWGISLLVFFYSLGIFYAVLLEMSYPADEKTNKIDILMAANGVTHQMNLFSWLISGTIWSCCYLIPIVIMFKLLSHNNVTPFLDRGNAFIVLIALIFKIMNYSCFTYHLLSYFSNPDNAITAFTAIVTTIMPAIEFYGIISGMENSLVYVGIVLPHFLIGGFFREISAYEMKLEGIGWFNMFTAGQSGGPSFAVLMMLSIVGMVFHFYMALFVNAIHSGNFKVAQHLYYFLKKKKNQLQYNQNDIFLEQSKREMIEFEIIPQETLEPGIRVINLKKDHTINWLKQTKVRALKGVSVQFYRGQITALLGHNGAGKSTLINIMSGLTSASDGLVFINGKNINETTKNNVGFCPQGMITFPDLNVYENLMFFGKLRAKSKSIEIIEEKVEILLAKLNMTEKHECLPKNLSGGQQRRLCLAIALIGDSDVLILDEPTSGMDPETKREVWDILLKMRGQKTIIISTHDMEEADILGDRIVILDSGELKSYGSPMYLKRLFGNGKIEVTLSVKPQCSPSEILETIKITNYINVLIQNDKIILRLPMTDLLPKALDTLENLKKELGITDIRVSIITLEEVFLRITTKEKNQDDNSLSEKDETFIFTKTAGITYFMQTFVGFLTKNSITARKYTGAFWFGIILICLSFINILIQLNMQGAFDKLQSFDVTLKSHPNSKSFVRSSNLSLIEVNYNRTVTDFGGETENLHSGNNIIKALLTFGKNNYLEFEKNVIVSAEFDEINGTIVANGLYSTSSINGILITINCISNTLLKTFTNDSNRRIEISTELLPKSRDSLEYNITEIINLSIIIVLGLAATQYIIKIFREKKSGIKHLQDMTGASKIAYWISMFIIDFIQNAFCIFILVALLIALDNFRGTDFYHASEIGILLGLSLGFGIGFLPFIYVMSFIRIKGTLVSNILIVLTIILGLTSPAVIEISPIPNILLLVPHFNLAQGLHFFSNIAYMNTRCRRMSDTFLALICTGVNITDSQEPCCSMKCSNGSCEKPILYFPESNFPTPIVKTMFYFMASFILFFAIILILEQNIFTKIFKKMKRRSFSTIINKRLDNFVQEEQAIVKNEVKKRLTNNFDDHNENVFLVHDLKKSYGYSKVVKNINFRVKQGECFGLLGVNGAGKSATFKMLAGAETHDGGKIFLKNFEIHNNRQKYLEEVGYCPQKNTYIEGLNAWDHLYLFARLRGIPKSKINDVVKYWVNKLDLNNCADQPSETYSGGNKRRLNIALALIGNPSLILMDEPTAGVDPTVRRKLWKILKSCQELGQSIILTSHSMEECEILSNRLVIMVNGQLVCIGTVQELKQRFGAGYNIKVKIRPTRSDYDIRQIKRKIEFSFDCEKREETSSFLDYYVNDPHATWTFMIESMRELANDYECIEDFVILSSTLEQLFIQIAKLPEYTNYEEV